MADLATVLPATAQYRVKTVVARSDGSPITTGTVNYYLKALTGANAGKWWDESLAAWQLTETANTMTHQADGNWSIQVSASAWVDGTEYVEYVKESGNLHIPDGIHIVCRDAAEAGDAMDLVTDAVDAAAVATDAIDADALAADAVTEIQSGLSTLTAQQVWEYASRTLTGFGTLITDIWSYATRTLTSYINGPYTLTATVTDGTDPISGISFWLKDSSGNLRSPPQDTDANGQVSWTVPDGAWVICIASTPTHSWDASTKTVTVSGADATATFTGTAWSVPTPSSSEYCAVYGYIKDAEGNVYASQSNAVQVTPEGAYRNGNTGERVTTVYADTDANGYFSVDVLKSIYSCKDGESSGSGTGTYRIEVKSMDLNSTGITIPDQSSAVLFDLTHA